jgi:hypothetical protein
MAEAHAGNGEFEDARAFAYVYLRDAMHAPHLFIRRAMEQACGAPAFQLAASARGVGIMKFNSAEERDAIVAMSPVAHEGNLITVERHEEADNRFYAFYRAYAEVAVVDYPLEHWDEDSAREVLAALGNVCCLDPMYFGGGDYTSMRAVLRLDHHRELPEQLLVRNHNGPACLANVCLVRTWVDAGPEPDWGEYDFGHGPELHTAPHYHPVGNPPTQLPPAPENLVAAILEWVVPTPPLRPVRTRQATPYPGRQASGLPPVLYLPWYGIGGVPALTPAVDTGEMATAAGADGPEEEAGGGAACEDDVVSTMVNATVTLADLTLGSPVAGERSVDERENRTQRRRARRRRARESARELRRSLRLQEKETAEFEMPEDRASRVQQAKFDFSGASRRLRTILSCSYLSSPEFSSSDDTDSLIAIAAACGATDEEVAMISGEATAENVAPTLGEAAAPPSVA